jgi:hypothetical protein
MKICPRRHVLEDLFDGLSHRARRVSVVICDGLCVWCGDTSLVGECRAYVACGTTESTGPERLERLTTGGVCALRRTAVSATHSATGVSRVEQGHGLECTEGCTIAIGRDIARGLARDTRPARAAARSRTDGPRRTRCRCRCAYGARGGRVAVAAFKCFTVDCAFHETMTKT